MVTVSNTAELTAALKNAKGGETIELAAGDYGALDLTGMTFASNVTITSANSANPAEVDKIDLSGAANVTIDGLHVNSSSDGDAGSKVVKIVDAKNVSVVNCEVNATVDGTADYNDYQGHYGIFVQGSSNIVVDNNDVHDVRDGVTVMSSSNVQVSENDFDYLGHDTIKIIYTKGVLIENNTGPQHLFAAPGAHKDFIQFGGGNSSDIVIRGNVYLAGNNPSVQGIFMDDATYTNVLIENNIIYTGMVRGISISSGSGITVKNNTVLNLPDDGSKATIILVPSGSTVENNIISGTRGEQSGSNLVVQHSDQSQPFHYMSMFENGFAGMGATLDDLRPLPGSAAAMKGAPFKWH